MIISTAAHPEGIPVASEALDAIIHTLRGQRDPYAILSGSDPMTYMQTVWTPGGYVLEYQEGTLARHFRTINHGLSAEDVIVAFRFYAAGESAWRTMFEYQRVKMGSRWYHAGYAIGRAWGEFWVGFGESRGQ